MKLITNLTLTTATLVAATSYYATNASGMDTTCSPIATVVAHVTNLSTTETGIDGATCTATLFKTDRTAGAVGSRGTTDHAVTTSTTTDLAATRTDATVPATATATVPAPTSGTGTGLAAALRTSVTTAGDTDTLSSRVPDSAQPGAWIWVMSPWGYADWYWVEEGLNTLICFGTGRYFDYYFDEGP